MITLSCGLKLRIKITEDVQDDIDFEKVEKVS
jgi:hypothetical protein